MLKRLLFLAMMCAAVPCEAAIALDATAGSTAVNNTTISWNHVVSGSDRILWAAHVINSASDLDTSCVFNTTETMSLAAKFLNVPESINYTYLYYLVAPSTGTHAIVCTTSSSILQEGSSVSYTGAKQTGQPDSTNTGGSGAATSFTLSTTVVATNCWLVGVLRDNGAGPSAGTGTTLRVTFGTFAAIQVDSNGTVGTGSQSLQATVGVAAAWSGIVASMAAVDSVTGPPVGSLMLLGVGR